MKSLSALSDFYYKSLYPELQRLEKERLALKNRIITLGVIYTTFAILLGSWLLESFQSLDLLLFGTFAYFGVGGFLYKLLTKEFAQNFKTKVIAPLIHSIDEKLNYLPQLHLDANYVTRSKIFNQTPDRVSGSDYVYGRIDGVEIKFSDLHLEKKHKDSKGRTSWSTIFKGLFIIADFHKNFHGTTVVLPDSAQSTFGSLIGSWLQSYNFSRDQLIKMDNVAFEEAFVVYGSDQIESRYILTPALMQKVSSSNTRHKRNSFSPLQMQIFT